MDTVMRMHSVTSTIENGFVHLPDKAAWLGEYLHELATFPKGKYDGATAQPPRHLERELSQRWPWGF